MSILGDMATLLSMCGAIGMLYFKSHQRARRKRQMKSAGKSANFEGKCLFGGINTKNTFIGNVTNTETTTTPRKRLGRTIMSFGFCKKNSMAQMANGLRANTKTKVEIGEIASSGNPRSKRNERISENRESGRSPFEPPLSDDSLSRPCTYSECALKRGFFPKFRVAQLLLKFSSKRSHSTFVHRNRTPQNSNEFLRVFHFCS